MFMLKTNSSKSLTLLTAAISSLMMVACSSDDDDGDSGSNTIQPPEGANSVWARDCRARDTENETFFRSHREFVTIEGLTSERTRMNYSDSDCQLMTVSTSNDVTVEYSESGVDAGSGLTTYPVDITLTEYRITPTTQELTDIYNDIRLCGLSNYATNEASILPIDCNVVSRSEDGVTYGLWAIDGDLFYSGIESTIVNGRPTTLLFDRPFRRQ